MADFNWDDHPVVDGKFNWNEHPIVKSDENKGVLDTLKTMGGHALDTLGYAGRVARTAIDAPLSDDTSMSDVLEQASHLYPENASKPAVSGQKLLSDIKLPSFGINPNFQGTIHTNDNVLDALSGTDPNAPGYAPVRAAAGIGAEIATDPMMYSGPLFDAAGDAANAVGKKTGQLFKGASEYLAPAAPSADVAELQSAADNLGIKLTPSMKSDSTFLERLEGNLAKSPSYFGGKVRDAQEAVTSGLQGATDSALSEAGNLSPYQTGEKFKSGLTSSVGERLDPISSVFDDVAKSTKEIPISERSSAAITRNIEDIPAYRLTGGAGKPAQYVDMINKAQNADDVKTIMTLLRGDIQASEGAERQVLIGIKDKLSKLESNSIMRAAISQAQDAKIAGGEGIGRDLVGDLKDARSGYRDLAKDLNSVAENSRIEMRGGPSQFLNDVEAIPSEKIPDKFFNLENNRQLQVLQEKFPDQFELLRQGKLNELRQTATDVRGETSTAKFLREVNRLNPEAKQTLFASKAGAVGDIEKVQQAIPRNFNPSGTASEQSFRQALWSNVKDVPNYALYKWKSGGSNLSQNLGDMATKVPQMFGKFANTMQSAAQRGPQAIAATHFILQQSNPEYRELINKLQEDNGEYDH